MWLALLQRVSPGSGCWRVSATELAVLGELKKSKYKAITSAMSSSDASCCNALLLVLHRASRITNEQCLMIFKQAICLLFLSVELRAGSLSAAPRPSIRRCSSPSMASIFSRFSFVWRVSATAFQRATLTMTALSLVLVSLSSSSSKGRV